MEQIKLWEKDVPYFVPEYGMEEPYLVPFIVEGAKKCMLVCPGGAYIALAEHEGEGIAERFNEAGISAFVLHYRRRPYDYRAILSDGHRAMRLVRYLAPKYGYDADKIGVMGFSAGGHLASCISTHYDDGDPNADDPVERVSSRPDLGVLCYAVISLGKYTHSTTRDIFLGSELSKEQKKAMIADYSGELAVRDDNPPMFLWHIAADAGVAVENSINMALALGEKHIPYSLNIYPFGWHGSGLSVGKYYLPLAGSWMPLLLDFIALHFDKE